MIEFNPYAMVSGSGSGGLRWSRHGLHAHFARHVRCSVERGKAVAPPNRIGEKRRFQRSSDVRKKFARGVGTARELPSGGVLIR